MPSLTAALDDEDGGVRKAAAAALGEIGPPAKSAVPALFKLLEGMKKAFRIFKIAAIPIIILLMYFTNRFCTFI